VILYEYIFVMHFISWQRNFHIGPYGQPGSFLKKKVSWTKHYGKKAATFYFLLFKITKYCCAWFSI